MKILTFTESLDQLRLLLPEIQEIYWRGGVDGMSVVATDEEYGFQPNPFVQRRFDEFARGSRAQAARRALLEERPARVFVPGSALSRQIREWCAELGIAVGWASARPVERSLQVGPRFASADEVLRQLTETGTVTVPVNLFTGALTFRYGDYDNEFALGPADCDLQAELRRALPAGSWRTTVEQARPGGSGEGPPETPDGRAPAFRVDYRPEGFPEWDWLERFRLDCGPYNILFLDSQNVAGAFLSHCYAVNRYTHHRALAVTTVRHPFIHFDQDEVRVAYCDQGLTPELKRELEAADAFVFFDDDDENSPAWPFPLAPFMEGKAALHIYVGHRVHREVERLQRPGRTLLTPLPHLMRMYPSAHLFVGFPPASLDTMELRPPLSETDGILRVLHTPSLPHASTHRYYYHKDTDHFLEAAQTLKARHPEWQFWQLGGLPIEQVLRARQDCDLTFNQLRGYHGLSGDEAMYLERPMIQAFDQFNVNRHREYWGMDVPFPWVSSHPQRLADDMERLLLDPAERRRLGREGRQFMLKYFSLEAGSVPLIWYVHQAITGGRS